MRQFSPTLLVSAVALALFAQEGLAQAQPAARLSTGVATVAPVQLASSQRPLALDARGLVGVAPSGYGADPGIVIGTDIGAPAPSGNVMVLVPVTPTPELDKATQKELAKAKEASRSRNKQLLHTIAPRTNADRTDQMRDDPPGLAFTTPDRALPSY